MPQFQEFRVNCIENDAKKLLLELAASMGNEMNSWSGKGFWRQLERHYLHLFFIFILLNVAIKLPYLGESGLFLDEAAAIFHTQGSFEETIDFSIKDPTPPLFYLTLWGWMKMFGISEISARFPSMLLSAFSAGLLFLLGRRLGNVKVGVFAALLFSFSTININFAQEARAYAMASFLLLLSYYLFAGLFEIEGRRLRHFILLAIINTFLLYTHYSMAFPLVIQGFFALRLLRKQKKAFAFFVLSDLFAIASILPWYLENRRQMPPGKVSSWLKPPNLDTVWNLYWTFSGSKPLLYYSIVILLAGIVAIILKWRFVRAEVKMGKFGILIATGLAFLAPALQFGASHGITPVFGVRYTLYASLGFLLLLALLISLIDWKGWIPTTILLVFVVMQLDRIELAPEKPEDWKGAIGRVNEWHQKGSKILVCAHYQEMPFSYYWRRELFQKGDSLGYFLFKEGISTGCSPSLIPKLDSLHWTNVILIASGEEVADPENHLYNALNDELCLSRKQHFRSIDLYQFWPPPCDTVALQQFAWDFEKAKNPKDDSLLVAIPDAPSGEKVAYVGPNMDYSVAYKITAEKLLAMNPNRVNIMAKGKLSLNSGRMRMVYSMASGEDGYDWQAANLDEMMEKGKWTGLKTTLAIPPIKTANDVIMIYFWKMDAGEAWFDNLSMEFFQE